MINWLDDCHTVNLADIEDTETDNNDIKAVYILFNDTFLRNNIAKNNVTIEMSCSLNTLCIIELRVSTSSRNDG